MTDRDLEKLLRMVGEIDEISGARAPAHSSPVRAASWFPRPMLLGRLGVALAAAAAVAWLVFLPSRVPKRGGPPDVRPAQVAADTVSLCYTPSNAGVADARVDTFQSACETGCSLLAIFREWNADCECLLWKLHEWENGGAVAQLPPGEAVDIGLNVSGDPPVQQVLVLAVSRTQEALPATGEKAEALLECLNDASLSPSAEHDAGVYARTVAGCLPDGVTVLPQAFVVRP